MMAMHLKIADAELRGDTVPDFMQIAGIRELPGYWAPFSSPIVTVLAIALLPALVALLLGLGVFKRRVKGAYFAILSQALAAAFAILLVGQQSTGGSNGLNRFRSFFGFDLADPANRRMLFFIVAAILLLVVAATRQLMQSRYGELLVAVRDQEERVRFLGYDPANIKVVAYTVAAFFAGIAGAMFVPIVGIISPADIGIVPSIAFLIGVAIGGRTTLLGPVLARSVSHGPRPPCRKASPRPGPTRRPCCSSLSSASSRPESPGSPSSADAARKRIPPTTRRRPRPNPNWSRPDERTRIRRQRRNVRRIPRNS